MPEGASFTAATYSNAEGSRDYKLYRPSIQRREGLPLIVMLHGCTQSPDDFAAGTRMNSLAEEHGFFVAYPAQHSLANARQCWNWFKPEDQGRERGEPSLIAGISREVMHHHPVDPGRVYIAGLSAGGAAAAIMADAYPDLYAAVGVHSGLPAGAASDLSSAFDAMRMGTKSTDRPGRLVPAIIFHGEKDPIVNSANGEALAAQALGGQLDCLELQRMARCPVATPMSAPPMPIRRAGRYVNIGASVEQATPGQEAAGPALTPIRTVPTHQERWCGFSSSIGGAVDPALTEACLVLAGSLSNAR